MGLWRSDLRFEISEGSAWEEIPTRLGVRRPPRPGEVFHTAGKLWIFDAKGISHQRLLRNAGVWGGTQFG